MFSVPSLLRSSILKLRCLLYVPLTVLSFFFGKIVEKNKEAEAVWRVGALRNVLKEVHSLFLMFHGSIRSLLEKEPAAGLIRSQLYIFIMDYLSGEFLRGILTIVTFFI